MGDNLQHGGENLENSKSKEGPQEADVEENRDPHAVHGDVQESLIDLNGGQAQETYKSFKSVRRSSTTNSSEWSSEQGSKDSEMMGSTAVVPSAAFNPGYNYNHHAAAKACMALQKLLEGCLSVIPVNECTSQNKPKASSVDKNQQEGDVRVQWYDARCRVALKRVAHWLQIPWPTMVAFEVGLLSEGAKHLKKEGEINKTGNTLVRWAKIGAVAVGGGAAVAVTG